MVTILSLLALATGAILGQAGDSSGLTVQTSTGRFTGIIDPEFPHTRQFRAIPFAEPPVASLRWRAPQKLPSQPDQHRYVAKFPQSCPQFVSGVESLWNVNLTKGNLIYNGAQNDTSGLVGEATSEDCLYLAVWTPTAEIPPEGLPVLFFMTGGGFLIGGVELPWQIPTSWVERSQSHIVVSINYRLNIFGFPNARGLANDDQNLGILDQRIALEWVRDNIAAFGGDPKRIMQWGRSAGSVSTDIHAYAYPDDPIAQSYYMESGTIFAVSRTQDPIHSNFSFVARHVGCDAPCGPGCVDEDGTAELDCMRAVSMAQISNFIGQYTDRGETPALDFPAIVNNRTFFKDYKARSEAGQIARVPTLISMTANEAGAGVSWPPPANGPDQAPITAVDVAGFVCTTFNSTVYRSRLGIPVYRFQYAAEFPNLNVYKWLGAYHNSETPLVFGTYHLLDHIANSTAFQAEMSVSIQDHILAFAKDPYNGPQQIGWQPSIPSDPNGGSLLRFGGSSGELFLQVDGVEVDGACLGIGEYNPFP